MAVKVEEYDSYSPDFSNKLQFVLKSKGGFHIQTPTGYRLVSTGQVVNNSSQMVIFVKNSDPKYMDDKLSTWHFHPFNNDDMDAYVAIQQDYGDKKPRLMVKYGALGNAKLTVSINDQDGYQLENVACWRILPFNV